MQHCYICGASIPGLGYRRVVGTGSSRRTYYGKRISFSRSRSEGLRTVCQSCAEQIDRQNRISGTVGGIVVLVVAGIFIYNVASNSNVKSTGDGPSIATVEANTPQTTGALNDIPHVTPTYSKEYVIRDGYDALGYDLDLPNMPIRTNTPLECQESCSQNTRCVAFVFNKRLNSCFLKSSVGTLFQNDTAYLGYIADTSPRVSQITTLRGYAFVGKLYIDRRNIRWSDCALSCDEDQGCVAFNYDNRTRECIMFSSIIRKIVLPTASAGVKAGP